MVLSRVMMAWLSNIKKMSLSVTKRRRGALFLGLRHDFIVDGRAD